MHTERPDASEGKERHEFLGQLAHDVRNLLGPIDQGLHILAMTGGDGPLAAETREVMSRQVRALLRLFDELVRASDGPAGWSELTARLRPPVSRTDTRRTDPASAEKPAAAPGSRRVLVVDDSETVSEMLVVLLERWGHQVRVVPDGPGVLGAVQAFRPHLVLCDLELPGMDGYEVARQVRGQEGLSQPRLVALTAHAREEDRRRCREAGFDQHMAKPVEAEPLKALIASIPA